MKLVLTLFLSLFFVGEISAQNDTTHVQLIQFSDGLDNRRAWRYFPPDTTTYRQILMYQTLKCDPTLIDNPTGSGCGEWDAGANFILYHHDNVDSLRYFINAEYPDTILVSSVPTYTYHQQKQYAIVYDNILTENSYSLGAGAVTMYDALNDGNANAKSQFLWTAAELSAAGLTAGTIDRLELDLTSLGAALNYLTVNVKHSSLTGLSESNYETGGFQQVYNANTSFGSLGINTINFTSPFVWDGVSNVVIELNFTNPGVGIGHTVNAETTASNMTVHSTIDDGYLDFSGAGDFVDIPDMTMDFANGFSISTWIYYDGFNSWSRILDCYDSSIENGFQFSNRGGTNGIRIVAKENGSGSNLTVDNIMNLNEWTHIAVSITSGSSATLYINGVAVGTATIGNPGVVNLTENFIGKSNNPDNGYFDGRMNNISLWNTALSSTEINDWMYKDIDPTHPSYADLKFYYKFDGMTGNQAFDSSPNAMDGTLTGTPDWKYLKGHELNRNMLASNERPNINLIQGNYVSHLDSTVFMDSVQNSSRDIIKSSLYQDLNEVGMSTNYIDTNYYWEAGYSYIYDELDTLIDSVWVAPDQTFYNYYEETNNRIARYITPYGNYLDLGAGFTWVYDLTQFEPWLHDTIDFQGGDHRELIDWRFEFIQGTPPRTVNTIEKILTSESGKYEDIVQSPPTSNVTPDPNSETFGLRYSVTGHSFNNPTNCAEFCARTHYFEVNGSRIYDWLHMKECADNPLYPQGGTWIYDRTGWCPGEAVDWFDLDLTSQVTPGVPVTLTYGVDPDPSGTEYGNWSRTMFFMGYSAPNFNLDAEVYDIISPNSWEYYGRYNPICDNPVIEIRNSGATTLTSVEIEYGVLNGTVLSYQWNGSLDFMEVERVVLPMHHLSYWQGSSTFFARIVTANGATDDYADNDEKQASFEAPPTHDTDIELNFKTNNAGNETSWDLRNGTGTILYSGSGYNSNTVYDVPVTLPIGCYTLNVYDTGDDGLDFWANNDGVGYFRIKNSTGQVIKTFEADFGDNIHYQFSVGESVGIEKPQSLMGVNVFPNPSTGIYNVQFSNLESDPVLLEVFDALGALVYSKSIEEKGEQIVHEIDLTQFGNGIYNLRFKSAEGAAVIKLNKH